MSLVPSIRPFDGPLENYRAWLKRRRENPSMLFHAYDQVTSSLLRGYATPVDEPPAQENQVDASSVTVAVAAPAVRFTKNNQSLDEWRRIFAGLVHHCGADRPLDRPRMTILTPLWNTKPLWIAEAAVSVFDQTSSDWEWCLVDDGSSDREFEEIIAAICDASPRVRYQGLARGRGISEATNTALRMAKGEWVCCLDHDDLLHAEAIELCLQRLEQGDDAVYTDSGKADQAGICSELFYKPDWSPEYLRGVMYAGHLLCVNRQRALEIGGFDSSFDGTQDFEFLLRYSERWSRIGHISRVLYWWRTVHGSTAVDGSAKDGITAKQKRAVNEQLRRMGLAAEAVETGRPHRIASVPAPRSTYPEVSIIVAADRSTLSLGGCVESLREVTKYPSFQILCSDCSQESYSRANNRMAKIAAGELLIFVDSHVTAVDSDWIDELVYFATQSGVGAIGPMLIKPDGGILQCCFCLGPEGEVNPVVSACSDDGYAGSIAHARECSIVTSSCLMIRKQLFLEMGGFNGRLFHEHQHADLCLRLIREGYRNIYAPRARLQSDSILRRQTDAIDRTLLFEEFEALFEAGDPYFNRNFDCCAADYSSAANADTGQLSQRVKLWMPEPLGNA